MTEPSAPPPYSLSEENDFLRREIERLKKDMRLLVQASVAETGKKHDLKIPFLGVRGTV